MNENESSKSSEPAKVVGLRGATPPNEPVPNVVRLCEELLEGAKSGRIRAVAIADVRADRTAGSAWEYAAGEAGSAMTSFEGHALGGAIARLFTRFNMATGD